MSPNPSQSQFMTPNRVHQMLHRGLPRPGKFAAAFAVSALLFAVGAGVGVAGNPSKSSPPTCTPASATFQPFLSWNDHGSYFLAPGGAFEGSSSLQGWSTSGSVNIVSGNESYNVHSRYDSRSLSIGRYSWRPLRRCA